MNRINIQRFMDIGNGLLVTRVAMGREEVRLTLEANGSSEMVLPRAMSEERLRR